MQFSSSSLYDIRFTFPPTCQYPSTIISSKQPACPPIHFCKYCRKAIEANIAMFATSQSKELLKINGIPFQEVRDGDRKHSKIRPIVAANLIPYGKKINEEP